MVKMGMKCWHKEQSLLYESIYTLKASNSLRYWTNDKSSIDILQARGLPINFASRSQETLKIDREAE